MLKILGELIKAALPCTLSAQTGMYEVFLVETYVAPTVYVFRLFMVNDVWRRTNLVGAPQCWFLGFDWASTGQVIWLTFVVVPTSPRNATYGGNPTVSQ